MLFDLSSAHMLGVRETLCDVYITYMECHYVSVLDGLLVLVCLYFRLFSLSFVFTFQFYL